MPRTTNVEAFIATLETIDSGFFIEDAADVFCELVKTCKARGVKGGFTLTIGLKPNARGEMETVCGADSTLPKREKFTSILFATEQGLLQRRDPRQPELPLQGLEAPGRSIGAMRIVEAETA